MRASRCLSVAATALAATAALSACELGSQERAEPTQAPAADSRPPPAEIVRRCRTAVYGARPTRKHAVGVGPISLVVGGGKRPAEVEPSGVVKVLVLLRTRETATVIVPEDERGRLSLLYDIGPGPKRELRLSDGTSSVRFEACTASQEWVDGKPYPDEHETQFNGGFFVRGPQCALLDVWIEGQTGPSRFGVEIGGRPCPSGSA